MIIPDSGQNKIPDSFIENKSFSQPDIQKEKNLASTAKKVSIKTKNLPVQGTAYVHQKSIRQVSTFPPAMSSTLRQMVSSKQITPEEFENIQSKLESVYNESLPDPGTVIGEGDDAEVILWRGCRPDQLILMVKTGSAGGKNPAREDCGLPSEKEARAQVGELKGLPEFTENQVVAEGFGTANFVAAFKIAKKHLLPGSVSEAGFVTNPDAPVELVAFKNGRTPMGVNLNTTENRQINARSLIID